MKILGLMKYSLDVAEIKVEPSTKELRMSGVPENIGNIDKNVVEAAARLKEETGASLQGLTLGPHSDGFYALGKFIGGNTIMFGQSEMQTSSAIKTGTAVNHLGADCVGNTLTFHVNGTSVAPAQDADLTSGDVGLLAGAFAQPGVDVLFDNFVVMQP